MGFFGNMGEYKVLGYFLGGLVMGLFQQNSQSREKEVLIRVSKKEMEELIKLRAILGVPVSDVIRKAICFWLERDEVVREALETLRDAREDIIEFKGWDDQEF